MTLVPILLAIVPTCRRRVWALPLLFAHALCRRDHGAKHEVLHDGELAEDLGDKHAAHAAINLFPGPGRGDVVEHGAVPAQALDRLCAVDEADLAEVKVVAAGLLEGEVLVDGARGDVGVVEELGGAEEEGQELVVVEAPDAVGAGGLEVVEHLHGAHDLEVARKDAQHERGEVGGLYDAETVQAQQPDGKVELVTGAVVDAVAVAKGLGQVGGRFGGGAGGEMADAAAAAALETELAVPSVRARADEVEEAPKGLVAEARATLLVGWRELHEGLDLVEDAQQRPDGLAESGVVDGGGRAGCVDDGLGEAKHPANNGAVGRGGQEELMVPFGEDAARGYLEGPVWYILQLLGQVGRRGDGRRVRGWRAPFAGLEFGETVFEIRYGGCLG